HRREARQSEADEAGPAVAEEDRGTARAEVVGQEPETRADERRRQEHEVPLPGLERHDAEEDPGDDAEPRRQAIHAVEELDRVRDRQEPEHGEDHVEPENAPYTATPPKSGVAVAWTLRSPGRSRTPHRRATSRTSGVANNASPQARTTR